MRTRIGFAALAVATMAGLATSASAQVKIAEVCGVGGGATTTPNADYVVLFNSGSVAQDMTGWSVQLGSGSSSSWTKINIPNGTILAAGGYYLIRCETAGTGYALPTPDLTNASSPMTSGSGKVALMANQTTIAVACPAADANRIDLFGYGSSTCFETTVKAQGAHTFGSNVSFQRGSNGCTDANVNNTDFATGTPVMHNSVTGIVVTGSASPISFFPAAGGTLNLTSRIVTGYSYDCATSTANSPTSTGQAITADLSQLGGGSAVPMTGTDGNPFTLTYTVPAGLTSGVKTVTFNATDSQGHTGMVGTATVTISAVTDLGTISTCPANLNTTIAANEVKWYKFTLPVDVSVANNNCLDLDTEGSSLTDTYMVLFGDTGIKLLEDDDDGSGTLSQMSFGQGGSNPVGGGNAALNRPSVGGGGEVYNGRDGNLSAGTYYLAALAWASGNSYGNNWSVVSASTLTGNFNANIKYKDFNSASGAPVVFNDLGSFDPASFGPSGGSSSNSGTVNIGGPGQFKWFKITLASGVDSAARTFLDLDTEGSALTTTAMALYSAATTNPVASDSNDGSGNYSQLTFGKGGRPAVGDGLAYNGRDGATLAAGEYYVVVMSGPSGAFNNGWAVTACGTGSGNITLNARAGYQTVVLPTATNLGAFTAPSTCSSTTLSSPGESLAIGAVNWYKVTLPAIDRANGEYVDFSTNGSVLPTLTGTNPYVNDTYMGIYNALGTFIASDDDDGQDNCSSLSFGAQSPTRANGANGAAHDGRDGATLTAGDYYIAVSEFSATFAAEFGVTTSGNFAGGTTVLNATVGKTAGAPTTVSGAPTTFTDLDPLVTDNAFHASSATFAGNEVKWFRFTTTAIDAAARTYLDIDTETTTGITATALGLFNSSGALVTGDFASGSGNLSQISLGFGLGRPGIGDGLPYDGGNGATLAAGTYYLAVSVVGPSNPTYAANFSVTQPASCTPYPAGTVAVRYRTGVQPPPAPPTVAYDLGTLTAYNTPAATPALNIAPGTKFVWVHFKTVRDTDAANFYVDIHTIGSSLPLINGFADDTEIALYNSTGTALNSNDQFGGTNLSGLSYGQTTPTRTYAPFTAAMAGGTAAVLPAGDYYVAIGQYNLTFAGEFSVSGDTDNTGTVILNVITNGTPRPCNAADVARLGGSPGPDGQNTVDDIVYYLQQFFANNVAVADIVGLGGPPNPPEGAVTVDDLVYFLNRFFSPCDP